MRREDHHPIKAVSEKPHGNRGLMTAIVVLGIGLSVLLLGREIYVSHLNRLPILLEWTRDLLGWKTVIFAGIIYAVLLSIPFFPGVELAWLIILLFGWEAAPVFYIFTILGLGWSFMVGRWLENSWFTVRIDISVLKTGFTDRVDRIQQKINRLLPARMKAKNKSRLIFRSRYVILAILVNLPGNSLIGGSGGIAFLCGMNRSFSWKGFIITIALAVSPVPILITTGLLSLDNVMF